MPEPGPVAVKVDALGEALEPRILADGPLVQARLAVGAVLGETAMPPVRVPVMDKPIVAACRTTAEIHAAAIVSHRGSFVASSMTPDAVSFGMMLHSLKWEAISA